MLHRSEELELVNNLHNIDTNLSHYSSTQIFFFPTFLVRNYSDYIEYNVQREADSNRYVSAEFTSDYGN